MEFALLFGEKGKISQFGVSSAHAGVRLVGINKKIRGFEIHCERSV